MHLNLCYQPNSSIGLHVIGILTVIKQRLLCWEARKKERGSAVYFEQFEEPFLKTASIKSPCTMSVHIHVMHTAQFTFIMPLRFKSIKVFTCLLVGCFFSVLILTIMF